MLPIARMTLLAVAGALAFAAPALASYTSEVAADGPTGYWPLETVPSAGVIFSSDSPGSRQARFEGAGATTTAGAVGGGAQLAGTGHLGIVTVSNAIHALTLEGLFRLDALPGPGGYAMLFDTTSHSGNAVLLAVDSAGTLGIQSNLDGVFGQTGAQIQPGAWHHVALTRQSGGLLRVYVDGALVYTHAAGADPLVPTEIVSGFPIHTIGGQPGGGSRMVGAIDEPAVYGSALSAARIAAHAAAAGSGNPNNAPVCQDLTVVVEQGTTPELTADCTDADLDTLTYGLPSFTTFAGGTLAVVDFDTVTYTAPSSSFTGPDHFDYTASDGTDADTATVDLFVHAPGATADVAEPGETISSGSVDVTRPDGGVVVITPTSDPAPAGYELAGDSFQIEAPDPDGLLRIVLRTTDPTAVVARDGVPITASCPSADACVESDTTTDGVRSTSILTPHASLWQVVRAGKGGKGCGDRNHAHQREADCKKRR